VHPLVGNDRLNHVIRVVFHLCLDLLALFLEKRHERHLLIGVRVEITHFHGCILIKLLKDRFQDLINDAFRSIRKEPIVLFKLVDFDNRLAPPLF